MGGDELLELEDGVGGAALYALALAEAIVCDDFDEDGREGVVDELALAHQVENLDLLGGWEIGRSRFCIEREVHFG